MRHNFALPLRFIKWRTLHCYKTHNNLVTEVRIIAASGLAWAVAMIVPTEDFWPQNIKYVATLVLFSMQLVSIALVVYFNVSEYREIHRSEKQIIANQVFEEVKQKLYSRIRKHFTAQSLYCSQFSCVISLQISVFLL